MIRTWLKNLFIEAFAEYEVKFESCVSANRDPNKLDYSRRPGTIWTNKMTGRKFVCKNEWHELKDE